MIPQDRFFILAKVRPACLGALRSQLSTMRRRGKTGMADPTNALVPFGNYAAIHFARFVVLEDHSLNDRRAFGMPVSDQPIYLCFMADCDGPADKLLEQLAQNTDGLRDIFRHCEEFHETTDLLAWLKAHRVKPMASYVNWVGRSVPQVREEACLHELLRDALRGIQSTNPQEIFALLKSQVTQCALTNTPQTPLGWRLRNLVHMLLPFVVAAVCLALFPFIVIALFCIALLIFIILLRRHEQGDPIVPQPYDAGWVALLREAEDHDVTNQYTAMGSIKPGRFRLWTEIVILHGIDWVARHIYTRGAIGRIGTIHFAHWVFLDQCRRGFFCSNLRRWS